jgi:delta-aminolevulinic acid dehydratase/porphobilinogen synthase
MFPVFVTDVPDMKEEIKSMPGQYRSDWSNFVGTHEDTGY